MVNYPLNQFLEDATATSKKYSSPKDIVLELAPRMRDLIGYYKSFLKPEHFQASEEHYARNLVYCSPSGHLSLFTMVWNPGQWTPVHDHGTWGVVGVIRGMLEERSFIRVDDRQVNDKGIDLERGGNVLLSEGSVTTFVPNPDHIHRTGVAATNQQAVSLHLYGRTLNDYHVYDLEHGSRKKIELEDELCDQYKS